jgi:hypothetical protein
MPETPDRKYFVRSEANSIYCNAVTSRMQEGNEANAGLFAAAKSTHLLSSHAMSVAVELHFNSLLSS